MFRGHPGSGPQIRQTSGDSLPCWTRHFVGSAWLVVDFDKEQQGIFGSAPPAHRCAKKLSASTH